MSERVKIERARDALRKAESEWQKAITNVLGVVNDNKNPALANAAFGAAADLTHELAEMRRSHWRVTNILLENWPEYGDVVVGVGALGGTR